MYEIVLDCGHHRFFTIKRLLPKVGATIVCQSHNKLVASKVVLVFRGWTVQCEVPKCIFNRQGFSDKGYAKELGKNHLDVFPDHAVSLFIAGTKAKETWEVVAPRQQHTQGEIEYQF